jgi:hypothetical protein
MALNEEQISRIRAELAPLVPELARAAPPERSRMVRHALERVGAQPTWEEWDAHADELLGADAPLVRSTALRL